MSAGLKAAKRSSGAGDAAIAQARPRRSVQLAPGQPHAGVQLLDHYRASCESVLTKSAVCATVASRLRPNRSRFPVADGAHMHFRLPRLALRSQLRIQQLNMILRLIETGTVRGAADELALSQSAVTKSLKELESLLGVPLFDRDARGLKP